LNLASFSKIMLKLLLLLHTAAAIVCLGSITHNLVMIVNYWRGQFRRVALEKLYVKVSFIAFLCTYLLGGIGLYPAFRYQVRYLYFDSALPWATGLFEIKEHWGALALAIFIVYYLLSRSIQPSADNPLTKVYILLGVLLTIIIWYAAIVGFLLVSYRSV
jgi:hypothetical protein